jgi:hypothetical protein
MPLKGIGAKEAAKITPEGVDGEAQGRIGGTTPGLSRRTGRRRTNHSGHKRSPLASLGVEHTNCPQVPAER